MFKNLKSILILIILIGFPLLSKGQSFILTSENLFPLYGGPIKWADLDNDNDLDIIYLGFESGANQYFTKVYENSNGSFSPRSTNLPNIRNGAFTLGDYDRDGDLDILLAGLSNTGNISVLYENNGSFSFSLKQSFPGLINANISWFDIDNDEDLDFLLAGIDDNSGFLAKMLVYENVNGNYSPLTGTNLPPCSQCSMDWADSNGDGKIDILITGLRDDFAGRTELYLNNGDKTFSKSQNSNFKDVYNGDVKWGDFDNDGDMDVLLSGVQENGNIITSIYKNTGGVLHEEKDIQIQSVGENWFSATAWVDYNNDGLLDIQISGRGTSVLVVEYIFKLYKNNGDGTFSEVSETNFSGISDCSVDFGDFDNDGDVDFCFSGMSSTGPKTGIYKNKLIDGTYSINSKPTPPSTIADFSERFFRKQVKLMWSIGADVQTPSDGLSYNFYLNHGTSKIVVPATDFTSGHLLSTNPPNGHGRVSIVDNIPEGDNSWAVQSIDGGKLGSLFSAEKTFYQINGPEATSIEILDVSNIEMNWLDNSSMETLYQVDRSTNPIDGFSPLATLPSNSSTYVDNYAFLTDTYYYYRVYAANTTKASAYDSLSAVIPTAPINLLAQSINASKINLTWEDLSQYESGYEVQRKLSGEVDFQTVATLAANIESYIDTGLSEGTIYDYRVRALVSNGSSTFSNINSAKTNFKPLGANFEKATLEDEVISFSAIDFTDAFSDPDGSDTLVEIIIVNLPSKGILQLNNTPVIVGQIIPKADLEDLHFIPLTNANGVSAFSFHNNDGKDNSAASFTVTVTITPVNDIPAFNLPTIVEADEDFTSPVKITPSLATVPVDELAQVVTYSIQPETSDKVIMSFNSNTGEISLTAVSDEFGEVQFILIANDGALVNNTFSDTVKLVINSVNDAPVLSSIPDQEVESQSVISPIRFTVTDVDSPINSIITSATSDNQLLIKNENITIGGDDQEKSIVLLPENNIGEALITLTVNDGAASTSKQFKLKIFTVTGVWESSYPGVKIYPNPTSSLINVTLKEAAGDRPIAVLFNQLGQEVSREEIIKSESTINLEGVSSGIYMLVIIDVNGNILLQDRILKK